MNFIRIMNDMKMKKKLALTFFSAAVLPLVLSGLFLTGKLREIVINNAFSQVSGITIVPSLFMMNHFSRVFPHHLNVYTCPITGLLVCTAA
ncbi:hypothetical protein J7E73_29650 [Paenibacillus albidus]|uniref:hypothetical protein n=1 Tax=Paenibacillus albidus TaxID=2041023 RepID=UPI001BE64CBF|nr:hypothetical protein [Paenibacillus albidus]MBT2293199.1 hypothetical protein [Paenibacillus albidus]